LPCFFLIAFLHASSTNAQTVRGLWYWTWSQNVNAGSTNLGIAFSGWADPDKALADSGGVVNKLQGSKFLSLGGGNANGHWTAAIVRKVSDSCNAKRFGGYTGLAFDIEEGDSGLGNLFVSTFKTCKSKGYKILVTISHSTPYGIPDKVALMNTFFAQAASIDYMSPQLYTSGNEGANDFTTNGVGWAAYKPFSGKLIPSIVAGSMYNSAKQYFANLGITAPGYVQWSQTASTGPAPPNSPPASGGTTRCGASWAAANSACGATCKTNADCKGTSCFADLVTTPCNRAVAAETNFFTEYSENAQKGEFSPLAIGLLVSQIILLILVVVVVVIVVLMFKTKVQERV